MNEPIPNIVSIELTSRCNSACVFCPKTYFPEIKGDMETEFAISLINECDFAGTFHLQYFGEPLLHPDFLEIARYAKSKGKKIVFYTNGALMNAETTRALLIAKVDKVIFSIDAHNAELYAKTKPTLDWDTTKSNILRFIAEQKLLSPETEAWIRICECEENKDEREAIVNYWKEFHPYKISVVKERGFGIPGRVIEPAVKFDVCRKIDKLITIRWDGTVIVCCCDLYSRYIGGNAHGGVLQAWQHPALVDLRARIRMGEKLDICQDCRGGN